MTDDPYVYLGTAVLRNKFGIEDARRLDKIERLFTTQRAREGIPKGKFDFEHLRAIHRHLFQDVYDWAGEVRSVEMSKGGNQFQAQKSMETGMADIHRRLVAERFLRNKTPKAFAKKAAEIIGDINYVHSFREGNGRSQLFYIQQLAEQAGHTLDLSKIEPAQWNEASKEAHHTRYDAMARCIEASIEPQISHERGL